MKLLSTSSGKFLAATQYMARHDSLAKIVHWWLCQVSSLPYSDKWWDHVPLPVVKDADTKVLLGFNILQTVILQQENLI